MPDKKIITTLIKHTSDPVKNQIDQVFPELYVKLMQGVRKTVAEGSVHCQGQQFWVFLKKVLFFLKFTKRPLKV